MPANKGNVRRLLGKIGRDPGLLDQLLSTGDNNKRKDILVKGGHLQAGDKPTRDEVKQEIQILLSNDNPPPPDGGRIVEWIGAIATAGAGAAAAACTGD
jgi:hypothetical protein